MVGLLLSGCATNLMDGIWGDDSASSAAAASSGALAPDMVAAQETAAVAKL